MVIKARFQNGVAVPDPGVDIPDGTVVAILLNDPTANDVSAIPNELNEEFRFWEQLGADGWEKFLEWEREASA